jgi:hypothetical protein
MDAHQVIVAAGKEGIGAIGRSTIRGACSGIGSANLARIAARKVCQTASSATGGSSATPFKRRKGGGIAASALPSASIGMIGLCGQVS